MLPFSDTLLGDGCKTNTTSPGSWILHYKYRLSQLGKSFDMTDPDQHLTTGALLPLFEVMPSLFSFVPNTRMCSRSTGPYNIIPGTTGSLCNCLTTQNPAWARKSACQAKGNAWFLTWFLSASAESCKSLVGCSAVRQGRKTIKPRNLASSRRLNRATVKRFFSS